MGAGEYRVDERQGAMHGGRSGLEMIYYGTDGESIFVRLDFQKLPNVSGLEIRIRSQRTELPMRADRFRARRVIELAVAVAELGYEPGAVVPFQISLWRDGLPLEVLPTTGWLELDTTEPRHWP
jgi:hypothetical protein